MSEPNEHDLTLFVAKHLYNIEAKQVVVSDDLRTYDGLPLYEGDYCYYNESYRGFDDLPDYINDFRVIQRIIEAVRKDNVWYEYCNAIIGANDSIVVEIDAILDALCKTPEQHCRAYYRVMNERVKK